MIDIDSQSSKSEEVEQVTEARSVLRNPPWTPAWLWTGPLLMHQPAYPSKQVSGCNVCS